MRKTFFIVGLLALLLFLLPVAAHAAPPGAHEDEDGGVTILHNEFVEQVISWFTELQSSAWPQIISDVASHNQEVSVLRDEVLVARINAILQALRHNILGD